MSPKFNANSLNEILGGRILYLVGMMGSGKSFTGPHLARCLNYRFIDQDNLIEQVTKKSNKIEYRF